jgi:poly(A) polymerase
MTSEKNVELMVLSSHLERLSWISVLESLVQDLPDTQIFIVGGALRNALLGINKKCFDMDLLVDPWSDSRPVAEHLAHSLNHSFFELDAKRATYRISTDQAQIDINGIRGDELMDDLFLRDFSIDALCLPLDNFLRIRDRGDTRMPILDYFQGTEDLRMRKIRIHNPSSFQDDPLRLLRAYRLAGEIEGFIDEFTHDQIIEHKELLFQVSGERIRDEWLKILAFPDSYDWLQLMDKSSLLSVVFPYIESFHPMDEAYTKDLQVRRHTLETLQYLEKILLRIRRHDFPHSDKLIELLDQSASSEHRNEVLLKLASLLHDIGKPDTLSVENDRLRFFHHEEKGAEKSQLYLKDLKLANKEIERIEKLILEHMRPHQLSNSEEISERAKYRFFRDLGQEGALLLLLALADAYATKRIPMGSLYQYEEFVSDMLDYGFREDLKKISPLLDGNGIMNLLGIEPSPQVGKILSSLLEAQHLNQVNNRKEAEEFILQWLASPDDSFRL